jgi:hypothetical protein
MAKAKAKASTGRGKKHAGIVRRATVWARRRPPREATLDQLARSRSVFWIDLVDGADPDETFGALRRICPGLTREMVADLLAADILPEPRRYDEGAIRTVTAFSAEARSTAEPAAPGEPEAVGDVVIQPVELLAGDRWLLSCWHRRRVHDRAGAPVEELDPDDGVAITEEVGRVWARGEGQSAGDLGVALMHELALSYSQVHRKLAEWLEDWELVLYREARDEDADAQLAHLAVAEATLRRIWGLRALLRDWLGRLNLVGLGQDGDRAWLAVSKPDVAKACDDRIDRALDGLAGLGDTLRSSFGLLHIQRQDAERHGHEERQRRIEVVAAAFLIPTFIVGFYGANTWVPGVGTHWGFWVMTTLVVALTVIGVTAIIGLHHARDEARRLRLVNLRQRP